MTIQQTIESLIKGLPHDDATELRALIQSWPMHDKELQQLLEANTSEILRLFQQSHLSPDAEQHSNPNDTTQHTQPDRFKFTPLFHLN